MVVGPSVIGLRPIAGTCALRYDGADTEVRNYGYDVMRLPEIILKIRTCAN
jgi:hypothetical protein